MKRIVRISIGTLFLVLGAAGLVLPLLQGWLFLAIGAMLLSPDVKIFARMEKRIAVRFPAIGRALARLRKVLPVAP